LDEEAKEIISKLEAKIKELEDEIKKFESAELDLDSLSGMFLVIDMHGKLQLVMGEPPEGYKTPIVKTEVNMDDYRKNKYNEETLRRFRFPNNNIIFRGGFAINPNSLEGKIIQFLYDEQIKSHAEDVERSKKYWKITKMAGEEAKKYMEDLKNKK